MACRLTEAGADLKLVDMNERGSRAVVGELSKFAVKINVPKVDLFSKEEIDALWEK